MGQHDQNRIIRIGFDSGPTAIENALVALFFYERIPQRLLGISLMGVLQRVGRTNVAVANETVGNGIRIIIRDQLRPPGNNHLIADGLARLSDLDQNPERSEAEWIGIQT